MYTNYKSRLCLLLDAKFHPAHIFLKGEKPWQNYINLTQKRPKDDAFSIHHSLMMSTLHTHTHGKLSNEMHIWIMLYLKELFLHD